MQGVMDFLPFRWFRIHFLLVVHQTFSLPTTITFIFQSVYNSNTMTLYHFCYLGKLADILFFLSSTTETLCYDWSVQVMLSFIGLL
jgi:hypothetical protein